MSNGWEEAAASWIVGMGETGDFVRQFVLDAPMLERARLSGGKYALDVGCGEGRFCRLLEALGISTAGIDLAPSMVSQAKRLHPAGDYRVAPAGDLPFADDSFDLLVSYLSLIDIPDLAASVSEMARVLRPGGHLLVANLTSFYSAGNPSGGWIKQPDGARRFELDEYMGERSNWVELGPIRVLNWHRPLSTYMSMLIGAGLQLRYFDEPLPYGGDAEKAAQFRRVPTFLVMDWQKE